MTDPTEGPSEDSVIEATRTWVDRVVIGLGLCPFAKAVQVSGRVRYSVSRARDTGALRGDLTHAMLALMAVDAAVVDTTLLIHPWVLDDFLDYNDFLDEADATLEELDLVGELQIASFHPDYRFADTRPHDMRNYSNRSPYPTLHLLREASVTRAVDGFPDPDSIYEKNVATLEALGLEGLERALAQDPLQNKPPRG